MGKWGQLTPLWKNGRKIKKAKTCKKEQQQLKTFSLLYNISLTQ